MTPEQLTGQTDTHLTEVLIGNKPFQVHRDIVRDLLDLKSAALKAGFDLCIASGFRNFERQAAIWNSKMAGEKPILDANSQAIDPSVLNEELKIRAILRWSALPGASRHHWGTDFDVYDALSLPQGTQLKLEPWEYLTGHQARFYQWLSSNLNLFGFYFPYHQDQGGVAPEPWHISHVEQSQNCLSALSVNILREQLEGQSINGANCLSNLLNDLYTQYITNVTPVEA
ncbi:M15 family metallopeptidase [Vibrio genomosp. F10]|uniref:Peptidase M15 n=2 Tax=Vibrio genomosp. F10 TaxID=723171 RepID=A0A1B9QYY1_9VIBR|nr:M15 family metallopeptidase [Vibrio genomosp. F10]OCH76116.1 peptidase M15 [Vibrio genomosp. F10]OEE35426.1 peptidase M15 [Vibrio genomosp. F10 str. ZF-129]OEE82419.1 peptidase M15 [Vibrio genomosp. F10 str. 9ZD137]OEE97915.1 peptidase M15 [Vibrio genomosp. F10 str. 9ZC157]